MLEGNKQATAQSMSLDELMASTTFANGAILVDDYDKIVFDDLRRNFPVWDRISKSLAPGETTGGFDQTAMGAARSAPVRNLGFTATSPTRSARTGRSIKAVVSDREFTLFDRSVYQQQGRRFGNLEQKDINDLMNACLLQWNTLFYTGDATGSPNEFDGLRNLVTATETVLSTSSVVRALTNRISNMINTSSKIVRPTAIYCNAMVKQMIELELLKVGQQLLYAPIAGLRSVFECYQLSTPVGMLPLIIDPFNAAVAGSVTVYPTFIVSEDKLDWQYIQPLGNPGAEPKTFEISMVNDADQQYKTVMFGALELLGGTSHHYRVNVQNRTTVVDPTA